MFLARENNNSKTYLQLMPFIQMTKTTNIYIYMKTRSAWSLSTKIFPKTKRGGAKNGQSPLLIRSEMEILNSGQMPNPELLLKLMDGNTTYT